MFSTKWRDIQNEVATFHSNSYFTWYRGQGNSNFKLNSGLYRMTVKEHEHSRFIATEKTYYNLFKRMGSIHHQQVDWDLLFTMQHHGVKTRLLDWSESFVVGLYFAWLNWEPGKSCSIYMLDPLKLNEKTLSKRVFYSPEKSYEECIENPLDPLFHENSLALYPNRNNQRIQSQQGMFTLQGVGAISLEDELNYSLVDEGVLKK